MPKPHSQINLCHLDKRWCCVNRVVAALTLADTNKSALGRSPKSRISRISRRGCQSITVLSLIDSLSKRCCCCLILGDLTLVRVAPQCLDLVNWPNAIIIPTKVNSSPTPTVQPLKKTSQRVNNASPQQHMLPEKFSQTLQFWWWDTAAVIARYDEMLGCDRSMFYHD